MTLASKLLYVCDMFSGSFFMSNYMCALCEGFLSLFIYLFIFLSLCTAVRIEALEFSCCIWCKFLSYILIANWHLRYLFILAAELLTTNKLSELACLALYLMYEKKQGKNSFWYPYIRELDRQRGRGQLAVESPLLWSQEELDEYFAGSPMRV